MVRKRILFFALSLLIGIRGLQQANKTQRPTGWRAGRAGLLHPIQFIPGRKQFPHHQLPQGDFDSHQYPRVSGVH